MTHAFGVRATSMLASTALMGLAVLAALSVTYSVQVFHFPDPAHEVTMVVPPPPTPLEPPHPTPPTQPIAPPTPSDAAIIDPLPPVVSPISTLGEPSTVPGPVTITDPHWSQRPRDLARYYPRRAMANNVEGQVVLDCLVNVAGALSCRVVSETPANWGFGDAALRISRDYAMVPASRDGQLVEGRYRMRVPFDLR